MDPDELAETFAAARGESADNNTYDGRMAVLADGRRAVWRGNARTGRLVALSYETADPQSRERVEGVQSMANVGNRTLPLATRFVQRNLTAQTGGVQNDPEVPSWVRSTMGFFRPNMINDADQMRAISNQMVGANWQPGTTGMYNTATEQEMARQRYPAPTNRGPANVDVYLNMAEDIAVQRETAQAMRDWLSRNTNLDGFDQDFSRREAQVRARARNEALRTIRQTEFANNNPGQTLGASIGPRAAPRATQPAQGADIVIDASGRVVR
jgi:hypothetical protein